MLHRADIQVVWEASLAHRGHVCHRSGTDTSCPWQLFWRPPTSESQMPAPSTPQGVSSRRQLPYIHLLVGTKERQSHHRWRKSSDLGRNSSCIAHGTGTAVNQGAPRAIGSGGPDSGPQRAPQHVLRAGLHPAGMRSLPEPGRGALQGAQHSCQGQVIGILEAIPGFFELPPEKQDFLPLN